MLGDTRTPARRRAQSLADLARFVLDRGLTGAGSAVRPHLNVLVSWADLTQALGRAAPVLTPTGSSSIPPDMPSDTAPTGSGGEWLRHVDRAPARWLDGTGPVPSHVLHRLACDGEISRVVFGPDSQILNVGRRERTVSGAKRRAVIARDQHCVWPTCDAPPSRCEVHHAVTHWADGGETSTDNAALLCWYHHDHVDTHGITMSRAGPAWAFCTRDGREITAGAPSGRRRAPDE